MNCRAFKDLASRRLVDLDLGAGGRALRVDGREALEQWGQAYSEHARECASCGAFWKRQLLEIELLSGLRRLSAPRDLEGRAVAAMQAGHRQQRAASAVSALPRQTAPPVLARRLEAEFITKAPDALLGRVEREFELSVAAGSKELGSSIPSYGKRATAAGAALLVLALWALSPMARLVDPRSPSVVEAAEKPTYRFNIVRVASPSRASLDPGVRQWIDGLAGGGLGSAE